MREKEIIGGSSHGERFVPHDGMISSWYYG